MMEQVKLKSSDGDIFVVDVEIAKCSEIIKTSLEFLDLDDDEIIPLIAVKSSILKKIIEWATHHKDDPPLEDEKNRGKLRDIPTWDAEFLKVDQRTIIQLIVAAKYLEIDRLKDVAMKCLTNMMVESAKNRRGMN